MTLDELVRAVSDLQARVAALEARAATVAPSEPTPAAGGGKTGQETQFCPCGRDVCRKPDCPMGRERFGWG